MKALSLTQPWATLVAIGAKKIETRSWSTSYRGPLLIHAAKRFPMGYRELCFEEPFRSMLLCGGVRCHPESLHLGSLLAVCRLENVISTEAAIRQGLGQRYEREFGDYSVGRFAWFLGGVDRLKDPIPYKGALGLFDVPELVEWIPQQTREGWRS
jgi:activating signal cointegrator 1